MTETKKMTFEEFKAMVKGRSDEEILGGVKGNEDLMLDGLFDSMKDAFDPEATAGQAAVIQYNIDTPAGVRSYQIKVEESICKITKEGT